MWVVNRFWSLGPEDGLPLPAVEVVREVLSLLDIDGERIEAEVFMAALASRYEPQHLLAAIEARAGSNNKVPAHGMAGHETPTD